MKVFTPTPDDDDARDDADALAAGLKSEADADAVYFADEREKEARALQRTYEGYSVWSALFIIAGIVLMFAAFPAGNLITIAAGTMVLAAGIAFQAVRSVLYHLRKIHSHLHALDAARMATQSTPTPPIM